jgi:PAS domain S-box-containing protein
MLGPIEDALDDAADLPAAQRGRLQVAHRNALRLLKLVNSLLDFSRVEAGRMQASFEPTDLAALTAELASNFRSACARAGLDLVVDCPPLPQPVYVDRSQWERIVLNLISNAFKFTFEGAITVSLAAVDGAVRLTVADTGIGIAAGELTRVFDRFHRVAGQEGRSHEGSGIGLSLVDQLARLHGGVVRAESRLGHGSSFHVTVPRGTGHLPADQLAEARALEPTRSRADAYVAEALHWLPGDAAPSSPDPMPRMEGRPRVLLADDNADMRAYVQRLLEEGGYEVRAVADGLAALTTLRGDFVPDLLLSDVMMPRLDGFGLLAAVRADPALAGLPVILLSARAGVEARVDGLGAGADDYLTKPFSARELRARVDGAVKLARERRQAAAREGDLRAAVATARGKTALAHSEHRLLLALQTGRMGSWELDLETQRFTATDYCRTLFGFAPDDPFDLDRVMARIHPDDRDHRQRTIDAAIASGGVFDVEYRVIKPDGQVTWIQTRGGAAYENGRPVRSIAVIVDVTARKAAEARQRLLLDELNHRVKNTLASVQSIALQTRRTAPPAQFDEAFRVRLNALARAHDLLSETRWEAAALDDVIERALDLYAHGADRFSLSGPPVRLGPNAALILSLAFHELATNAAKFGAFANDTGRIEVAWSLDVPESRVELVWRESGGPDVAATGPAGFGTRLLQRGVAHELGGACTIEFAPEGLCCRMSLPQSAKLRPAADYAPPPIGVTTRLGN